MRSRKKTFWCKALTFPKKKPAKLQKYNVPFSFLYGKGKPVEAVEMLSPWIRHVHAKDARAAPVPGTWGTEVAWGDGEVNAKAFLGALKKAGYNGVLSVEREAGDSRQKDIVSAVERIRAFE